MMDTSYLTEYYNSHDEDGRTKSRHGSVEFLTTMHYIRQYVPEGASVLDVGAGTGVYSIALAKEGRTVHAVELVEHNIEVFRSKLTGGERITVEQGNALDLSRFGDGSFDAVLLFGPMYHLYSREDKLTALREAKRVVKRGGHIFVAYCMNEATIIHYAFKGDGSTMLECLEKGMLTEDFKCISQPADLFEMVRLEDIDGLNREAGLLRVKIIAADLFTAYIRDRIDSFSDEAFQAYLAYHLAVCERGDLLGATNHSLDILIKE